MCQEASRSMSTYCDRAAAVRTTRGGLLRATDLAAANQRLADRLWGLCYKVSVSSDSHSLKTKRNKKDESTWGM